METNYQQQALAGATGMELILALYDGAIRFLYRAAQCVEEQDVRGRRIAASRALDILMYLQARLRPDLGGSTAHSLADFYAAMFTLTLEASPSSSFMRLSRRFAMSAMPGSSWPAIPRPAACFLAIFARKRSSSDRSLLCQCKKRP